MTFPFDQATHLARSAALTDSDAMLALQAFDPSVALLDTTLQQVRWCSTRFTADVGVAAGDPLLDVLVRLPAARLAIDALSVTKTLSRGCGAQALRLAAGLIALSLDTPATVDADSVAGGAQRPNAVDCERLAQLASAMAVTDLATTLAHEINQPLGAVVNVLYGLRAQLGTAGKPGHSIVAAHSLAGGVALALDQALYASRLVSRHRKVDRVQPRLIPLNPLDCLREALGLLADLAYRHGVSVDWPDSCAGGLPCGPVLGDALMLQQVFLNLVRNAIESMVETPRHARRLEVSLSPDDQASEWHVRLRDQGCGWPRSVPAAGFEPGLSTKRGGRGLGLSICRALVALHGGRLWCTPNAEAPHAGTGTTFHVALPVQRAPEPRRDLPTAQPCLS